jgi:hypothetical protein
VIGAKSLELADNYENLAAVPAEHAALYIEKDGKAVLQLTGIKTQSDFDAYATALKARLADAAGDLKAAKNQGMSRDEITALIQEVATKLKPPNGDGQKKGDDDDSALALRVHDLERELASTKEKLDTSETEGKKSKATATNTTIRNALSGAAVKAGVLPAAVDGLVQLLSDNFEMSADGKVVTKLEGSAVPGVTPNTAPEPFMAAIQRASDFSHFWPGSKGGGAGGGGGGGGGGGAGGDNPFSLAGWNLTAQGALVRSDRAEADRLAKAAGTTIGGGKPAK